MRLAGVAGAAAVGPQLLRLGSAQAAVVAGPGPYGALQAADANGIQLPAGFTSRLIGIDRPAGRRDRLHLARRAGRRSVLPGGGRRLGLRLELRGRHRGGRRQRRALRVRRLDRGGLPDPRRHHPQLRRRAHPVGHLAVLRGERLGRAASTSATRSRRARAWCDRSSARSTTRPPWSIRSPGHVYLTEDDPSGRLYRFTPDHRRGPRRRVAVRGAACPGTNVTWVPTSTAAPDRSASTTAFNGGEGAWIAGGTLWFTTKGDRRVWELDLAAQQLTVLYDYATTAGSPLNAVDNITRHAPSGDLYVAEDGGNMEVCLITTADAQDTVAPFLRFVGHSSSEVTGPAFSPDGTRLYVSSQRGTDGIDRPHLRDHRSVPHRLHAAAGRRDPRRRRLDVALPRQRLQPGHRVVGSHLRRHGLGAGPGAARLRRPDGHHGQLRPQRVGQVHHHLLPALLRGHPRVHRDDPAAAARRRRRRLRERHRGGPQQHARRAPVTSATLASTAIGGADETAVHHDRRSRRRSTPAPTSSRWRSTRAAAPAPTSASTSPSRAPATPVRSRLRRRRPLPRR